MKAPSRPSMSKARRARIFLAHGGLCGLCGKKITGDYDIEHRIPWAISQDDSDGNLYPAHKDGHKLKTKDDIRDIAKINRIVKKSDPATRKPSRMQSRPFPKPTGKHQWASRPFPTKRKP